MTIEEDQALSSPEYWDGRYAGGGGHEWFRSFDDLEPFLRPNLFETFASSGEPLILHLGSGDSVWRSLSIPLFLSLSFSLCVYVCLAKDFPD
jgi:hypothetical protein